MSVPCVIVLPVVSDAPEMTGNWSYDTVMHLLRVPVAGDYLEISGGWAAHRVNTVFLGRGRCSVRLDAVITNSPGRIAKLELLTDDPSWRRTSGLWTEQSE